MPKKQLNNKDRIFGLDLMRAFAILVVLGAHCTWILPRQTGMFSQLLALLGFLGVEIFFVLSGFLIGKILFRLYTEGQFNAASIVHFLRRRWFRTLPNYFLILVVDLIIAFFIGYDVDRPISYFVFMQNLAWPMPAFFPESWSLAIEEFAYILLPFMLFVVAMSIQKPRRTLFIATAITLILLGIAAKCIYHVNHLNTTLADWNSGVKSVVIYRLDSIFVGVLASWLFSVYPKAWQRNKMQFFLAGVFMMGFFTIGVGVLGLTIDHYPFFWNVIYLPLVSLSVALFLPFLSEWKSTDSVLRKPITFISLISYSIYLLHYSVILQILKQIIDTEKLSLFMLMLFIAVYISLTIFLSYLLYRFYERPLMDRREISSIREPHH